MNCPNCGLKRSDPFFSDASGTCPNCGHELNANGSGASDPIRQYFEDLKQILLKPHQFFRRMPRNGGLIHPLAFALIAHWIGSAIAFLWHTFSLRSTQAFMDHWSGYFNTDQIDVIRRGAPWASARHLFMQWFWGMGSVIGDPFLTLVAILIKAVFVFLGARLLVGIMTDAPLVPEPAQRRHEVTYESAVRIIAYGTVASIFLAIPAFGTFIAWAYGLYISMVGAKEIYQIGTGRSLAVVLFPQILLIALAFAILALVMLFGMTLMTGFFATGF
jgi:hypothetical protein